MKTLYLLTLLFISSILSAQGQLPAEIISNIEGRVDAKMNPSIVVGVVEGNSSKAYVFGERAYGEGDADEHSIYEIGSISKVFTGIMLADQIVKGNMSADDPISSYLKNMKLPTYEGKEITLGHLSDHTSSLPRMPGNYNPSDPTNPYADYTPELLYECLSTIELERPIGSEYAYSNLAQGLLGHILELHTGKSYETLLSEIITEPLGMAETRVAFSPLMKKNLAIGYSMGQKTSNWDIATLTGAGAIRSSVHDMMIFLSANLGLIDTPLKDAIDLSHQMRHDKTGSGGVALGWHIRNLKNGHEVITHGGATGGYRAFAAIDKIDKKGVIVLTNSDNDADDIGRYLIGAEIELAAPEYDVAILLREWIDKKGIDVALEEFEKLKESNDDNYSVVESSINRLGYQYMSKDNLETAIALFQLNIDEHPKSFNVYDSYAEALMEQSIANYQKSLELNPQNENATEMLTKMGVKTDAKEVSVSEEILEKYSGRYEIAPTFHLDVRHRSGRLFTQATGQSEFEIFPSTQTRFYLKVVEAQLEFHVDATGNVTGLTLYQGGRETPGKKVE